MKNFFSISASFFLIQINLYPMNFCEVQKVMRALYFEALTYELQERNKVDTPHTQATSAQNQVQPTEKQGVKKTAISQHTNKKK
jgi:hypothetical protein